MENKILFEQNLFHWTISTTSVFLFWWFWSDAIDIPCPACCMNLQRPTGNLTWNWSPAIVYLSSKYIMTPKIHYSCWTRSYFTFKLFFFQPQKSKIWVLVMNEIMFKKTNKQPTQRLTADWWELTCLQGFKHETRPTLSSIISCCISCSFLLPIPMNATGWCITSSSGTCGISALRYCQPSPTR